MILTRGAFFLIANSYSFGLGSDAMRCDEASVICVCSNMFHFVTCVLDLVIARSATKWTCHTHTIARAHRLTERDRRPHATACHNTLAVDFLICLLVKKVNLKYIAHLPGIFGRR